MKHTAHKNLEDLNADRWSASVLDWLAQLPDLNPIENLWYVLDPRFSRRPERSKNNQELFRKLEKEWNKLD